MLRQRIKSSEGQTQKLEELMTSAFEAFRHAAIENYGERNESSNVRRLRDDFKAKRISLQYNSRARQLMLEMIASEELILASYINLGRKLCMAFLSTDERPGTTIDDYLQEARSAIYDAMYTFKGTNAFSTYVYWCIKNKLVDFVRTERQANGQRPTVPHRSAILHLMRDHGIDLEAAMRILKNTGEIEEKDLGKIRIEMNSCRVHFDENVKIRQNTHSETELMLNAVNEANLTELEKELVQAHLAHDKSFVRKLSETRINPRTRKPYTKQRLSQIFIEACNKIRQTYAELLAA